MNPLPALVMCISLVGMALSLGMMEFGLRPEFDQFPCRNPFFRGVLAVNAFFCFVRAADLYDGISHGRPEQVGQWGAVTAVALCTLCILIFQQMTAMRLPPMTWARLDHRRRAAKRAMTQNPQHKEAVANLIAQGGVSIATTPGENQSAFLEAQ